jgi:WD40 repeat protein
MRLNLTSILIVVLLLHTELFFGLARSQLPDLQYVTRANWSPNGQLLAVGYRNILYLYDQSFKLVSQSTLLSSKDNDWVIGLAWKADNQTLAISSVERIVIWDTKGAKSISQFDDLDQFSIIQVTALSWMPNSDSIAIGSGLGTVVLWNTQLNRLTQLKSFLVEQDSPSIHRLEWNNDGKLLLASRVYAGARLFDTVNSQVVYDFPAQPQEHDASWSPDRKNIAQINSVSKDEKAAVVLYTMTGQEIWRTLLSEAKVWLQVVEWSPDGRFLAIRTSTWEPTKKSFIYILNAADGKQIAMMEADDIGYAVTNVSTLAWSPDGK